MYIYICIYIYIYREAWGLIIMIIGDARGRVKVVANPGNRDRVRGVSSVACRASVARDRWHRAWRAIDGTVRGATDGTVDKT